MLDEEPPRRADRFAPAAMDSWGVEDLRAYIAALQAEIARAEAAIRQREAQRSAADAFFKAGR